MNLYDAGISQLRVSAHRWTPETPWLWNEWVELGAAAALWCSQSFYFTLIIGLLSSFDLDFVGSIKSGFMFLDPERVTCGPRLSSALIYRPADRMFPTSLGRVQTKRCPDLQLLSFDRCLSSCWKTQWRVMADSWVWYSGIHLSWLEPASKIKHGLKSALMVFKVGISRSRPGMGEQSSRSWSRWMKCDGKPTNRIVKYIVKYVDCICFNVNCVCI